MMGTHDMETYKFFKDPKNYQTQNKVFLNLNKNKNAQNLDE